jgi:hypothetical protein
MLKKKKVKEHYLIHTVSEKTKRQTFILVQKRQSVKTFK